MTPLLLLLLAATPNFLNVPEPAPLTLLASRNGGGTYTLPAGNPVVTGTTITVQWANSTMPDIGTELSDSLSRSGKGGMLSQLALVNGTVLVPSLSWSSQTNTGLYRATTSDIRFSLAGADAFRITTTANFLYGPGASPSLTGTYVGVGLVSGAATASSSQGCTNCGIIGVGGASGGQGIFGLSGASSASAAIQGNSLGTGTAVTGLALGTSGAGVSGSGAGSSPGGNFTGGGTNGTGVSGTGGATNGVGVTGQGTGTAAGGSFTGGGTNGTGVLGTGIGNAAGGDFTSASGPAVVTRTGGLQIGPTGTSISASYRGTVSWSPAAIAQGAAIGNNLTVTGAVVGAECALSVPSWSPINGLTFSCYVSAPNQCTIEITNCGICASITPPNGTYGCRVWNP